MGRLLGRLVGRDSFCGWDCDITDFGAFEIALLVAAFAASFLIGRRVLRTRTRRKS
jgi:hypothetical protein